MHYARLLRTLAVTAGTLTVLSGCAASGAAGGEASTSTSVRARRDLITREELLASGAPNLYEAVNRLRPHWLRGVNLSNTVAGGTEVVVYQGVTQLGGLDALRQLQITYAESLRWLDASQASNTLPGLGSRRVAGAIVITLPGSTAN